MGGPEMRSDSFEMRRIRGPMRGGMQEASQG